MDSKFVPQLTTELDKHLNISKFNILICKMGILMQYLPCGATIELICIKELLFWSASSFPPLSLRCCKVMCKELHQHFSLMVDHQ